MNLFKNLKIRSKMLLGFFAVIAIVMTLVFLAVKQIRDVRDRYMVVISHPISLRMTLLDFQVEYRNLRRIGATIGMHAGLDDRDDGPLFADAVASYNAGVALMAKANTYPETNPDLTRAERDLRIGQNNQLLALFTRYYNEVTLPIIEAARTHDRRALLNVLGAAEDIAASVRSQHNDMLDTARATAAMHIERAEAAATSTIRIMVTLSALAVLLAVAVAFYVSGYITKPLAPLTAFMNSVAAEGAIGFSREDVKVIEKFGRGRDELGQVIAAAAAFVRRMLNVGKALERVSDGDLTFEVPLLSARDSMGLSFKKMMENLNAMCGAINASSIHVATGAGQVTAGAQALSAGATEQAASIEELSVAIAEMAERTKITAGMAGQAADLANSIKNSAEKSSSQMDEMMSAVGDISEASQSIRKIIKTIDEIAFQTNILAVNAAVEAAHAGKYGKGFSVVASEVRSLAAKSAAAAKDTERLIANSMEKAGLGVLIAGETATSLSGIVSGIKENSQLVAEIARSSEEQSQNIAQINIGVNQVSQVVQQNSSTAEESAAASEEMYNQSAMLQRLVAQFRLKEDSRPQSHLADNPLHVIPRPASPVRAQLPHRSEDPFYAQ